MRKARLIVGRTALGILVLAGGAGPAAAARADRGTITAGDLSARSVADGLAGEWDGQIEVRRPDGSLSTSLMSMSAKKAADGKRLELYYEGFAFGKPVEGAIVLSFDDKHESVTLRDTSTGLRARCAPGEQPDGHDAEDRLSMAGTAAGGDREVRAIFGRDEADSWNIEYHVKGEDGQWSSAVVMKINRLDGGQVSAAAANFAHSSDLAALREQRATAAADSGE